MSELIKALNRLPTDALQRMTSPPNTLKLWIEDGRITGFIGDGGKLHKEIPTQTANPGGDK